MPLRESAKAEGVGEAFASPRPESSEDELERIVSSICSGETRDRFYRETISRAGVEVTPAQAWLLGRLRDRPPTTVAALSDELEVSHERVALLAGELEGRGLVTNGAGPLDLTERGRTELGKLVEAGRAELTALLGDWNTQDQKDLAPVLRRLAASWVADIPEQSAV